LWRFARAYLVSRIQTYRPDWGAEVLERAYQVNLLSKDELLKHYVFYPEAHKKLISSFVQSGDFESAYTTFLQIGSLNGYDMSPKPFNPEFKTIPILPPFNWQLSEELAFLESDGIDVSYFGRDRPTILSQTFPLSPATYDLEIKYTGDIAREAGYLLVKLWCDGSRLIHTHEIKTGLDNAPDRFEFTPPDTDCPFIRLSLHGEPGIFPGETNLKLHKITITELN